MSIIQVKVHLSQVLLLTTGQMQTRQASIPEIPGWDGMASQKHTEISIDGSTGEGGGQILRTSLSLSVCIGRSFRIFNIRAARARPGLQPQHLAAVKAAMQISNAVVSGDQKGSQELVFRPGSLVAGDYHFSIGTAGSTTLVLQTILPALILADAPTSLVLEGGTHNPLAPSFDFLQHSFLPILNRMGPRVTATLEQPGFAPRGGGRMQVDVQPVSSLNALDIPERGSVQNQYAEVLLAHLPRHIAERELATLKHSLGYTDAQLRFQDVTQAYGPGNAVSVVVSSENITEFFTAFGQRGLPAEQVAIRVVKEVRRYLAAGVPVGSHLADQLLIPFVLAGGGMFKTLKPSSHTLTNIDVIRAFSHRCIHTEETGPDQWIVSID